MPERQAIQREAKAKSDFLAQIDDLTTKQDDYVHFAGTELRKFGPLEARYRRITEQMHAALAREQAIYGGGRASLARGQINLAINQAEMQLNQLHNSVKAASARVHAATERLTEDSDTAAYGCEGAHVASADHPVAPDRETWNRSCLIFMETARKFKKSVQMLEKAFDDAEAVWAKEDDEGKQVISDAGAAVR